MNNSKKIKLLISLIICVASLASLAQPVYNSGKEIQGIIVYQDLMQKSKYYYGPRDLELERNSDGSPKFKYLKMANSKLDKAGIIASLKDFNLIQVSLIHPLTSKEKLKQIRNNLGGKDLQLIPIPIDKFEFALLRGSESVGSHLNASYEGESSKLWEQKNITLRLSKAGAALVDRQIKDFNQIGIHFSYSYYCHFVTKMDKLKTTEDTAFAEIKIDTTISKLAYKTGVFDLSIDLDKWSESCIKTIVLNEATLPRYLPIQVVCYDFSDDLRPDLLVKKVTVCGDGLQGQNTCVELEFNPQHAKLNAYSLQFKLPVLLTSPLRYQVTEITTKGHLQQGAWETIKLGESIDITSAKKERKFHNQLVEIETDLIEMKNAGFQKVIVEINYQVNQQAQQKSMTINVTAQNSFLNTNFFHDTHTPISYVIKWADEVNNFSINDPKILDSDYLYLKP
ncbi:MAG: hypothetical protein ACI85O_000682 [Saprospiraceae bacterium]|jgi:hypothetical protein